MKKISNFSEIFDFKILNKYVYSKGLLREELPSNIKKSLLIDNDDNLFLSPFNLKKKLHFNNNYKMYAYNSKSLNLFSFELNRLYFSNYYKTLIINFNKILFCLNKVNSLKQNFFIFLIIKPKKGGFLCYYNGILGFFSRYKFFFYAHKFLVNFVTFSSKFKLSYLYSNSQFKKNLFLNFLSFNLKTQIYPVKKKKNKKSKFQFNNKFVIKFNVLFE